VSPSAPSTAGVQGACERCLRRSWLLAALSGPLDFWAPDRGRLIELLALGDDELLQAAGGRRKVQLKARYEQFDPGELHLGPQVQVLCAHDRRYPRALRTAAAPRVLYLAGGAGRLARLTAAPVVAIVGSRRASDYGSEMAKSLARGLAASGATVISGLADGIPAAAHAGGLEARRGTLAVMSGGLGASCPAGRRALHERIKQSGCAVAELPWDCRGRRWGQAASERILALLAQLIIVVEAGEGPGELAVARIAQSLGRTVAALPGRVTSPLSRGTNGLLMEGASLVRGPGDALDLLYPLAGARAESPSRRPRDGGLQPRLRAVLERVGAGCDTPERLCREGADAWRATPSQRREAPRPRPCGRPNSRIPHLSYCMHSRNLDGNLGLRTDAQAALWKRRRATLK
jgi:DNA processing protein